MSLSNIKYFIIPPVLLSFVIIGLKAQNAGLPYPTDTIRDTVVYRFAAPQRIGIYRISKTFNVSQEDIIRWNPQLRNRGPQLDEILLIPAGPVNHNEAAQQEPNIDIIEYTETGQQEQKATVRQQNNDKVHIAPKAQEHDNKTKIDIANEQPPIQYIKDQEPIFPFIDSEQVWRLAVILPFDSHNANRDGYNDRFYDFYTGLLTAVFQAQSYGMKLDIHTYDVPRTGNRLSQVLADPWLETAHAIIGPAYTNQVNKMNAWSQSHSVWTLIPFTSHVAGVENNPYILQFNPTPDRKARCIADTIENHKDSLHLIYVKADRKPSPEVAHLLQELNERNIHVDTVPLHAMLNDSADSIASDTLTNLIILHTDNYSNASVIIPHVKQLAIRHDVRLLAPDSWMQQEDILPLRPVYAYFFLQSDNNSSAANIYNRIHNYYFSSGSSYSPAVNYPRFDLLGYDLTSYLLYLLPSLYEHNNNLDTDINPDYIFYEPFTTGLQSNIHFVRTNADGGWINEYIQVAY